MTHENILSEILKRHYYSVQSAYFESPGNFLILLHLHSSERLPSPHLHR